MTGACSPVSFSQFIRLTEVGGTCAEDGQYNTTKESIKSGLLLISSVFSEGIFPFLYMSRETNNFSCRSLCKRLVPYVGSRALNSKHSARRQPNKMNEVCLLVNKALVKESKINLWTGCRRSQVIVSLLAAFIAKNKLP